MTALSQEIAVVNVGLEGFGKELAAQKVPVIQVDWRPPAGGDTALIRKLAILQDEQVEEANALTVKRMVEARPAWIDVRPAIEALPGLERHTILHSGPPIAFGDMCDPQQRAVEGAAIFEGLASGREDLERKLARRDLVLRPNYELGSLGAMCGVISPSMPVIVTEDAGSGKRTWSTFNEGKGNVLWMGAFDQATIERLRWMRDVLGPALARAVRQVEGGLDIFKVISEGIQMGDEVHARSAACTLLLHRWLAPLLLAGDEDKRTIGEVLAFIGGNNHSFLSLTLTACKVACEAAHGVPRSTVVTAMSRNGVDFAIRVGGVLDRWFIAPTAPMDEAIYYSGYGPQDAAGDIGDSAIVETAGLGGLIIGAAPSISAFVGGTVSHARQAMGAMRAICTATNPKFSPSAVDFMPGPVGIDIRKVVRTGVAPIIDTGVLHKASGVGQIGTGIARAPMEPFRRAVAAFPLP